jgi:hypothetical protein
MIQEYNGKVFSVHMSFIHPSIHPAGQADGVAGFFLAPIELT